MASTMLKPPINISSNSRITANDRHFPLYYVCVRMHKRQSALIPCTATVIFYCFHIKYSCFKIYLILTRNNARKHTGRFVVYVCVCVFRYSISASPVRNVQVNGVDDTIKI